jgi:osmotically-inducible protein OsmY
MNKTFQRRSARVACFSVAVITAGAAASFDAGNGRLLSRAAAGETPDPKSDREISSAIERQLEADAAVSAHLIDLQVRDGIAVLSGSVNHLLARERAQLLAETVRGVRSVVNTLTVNPVNRSDKDIATDAKIAIARDPATDLYEVGVEVINGTAILRGSVDSLAERQLAGQVVSGVRGIKPVQNDLQVVSKLRRPDNEIAADIRGRLQQNGWVNASSIEVNVTDAVATLTGDAGSAIERSYAIRNAWVAGVRRVEATDLIVRNGSEISRRATPVNDEKIAELIRTAWRYHPRLSAFKPQVESTNHNVTLTGVVDNLAAKKIAEEIAKKTMGVVQVENHLRVRPQKFADDLALAQEVKAALLRDPYVERFDMRVSARNSSVNLDGRVDSTFEKNYAAFVAARVPGVVDVNNRLSVVDLELPQQTDWELQQQIRDGLRWNPYIGSRGISISVKNGIAVLSGTASSWQERAAAAQIAQRAGAESVLNQVKVMGPSS